MEDNKLIKILLIIVLLLSVIFGLRITVFKDKRISKTKDVVIENTSTINNYERNENYGIYEKYAIEAAEEEARMFNSKISASSSNGIFANSSGINSMYVFVILIILIILISIVPIIIGTWKIFENVGIPGWQSIIPVLSVYRIYQISGLPGWLVFLGFIPYIGSLIMFVCGIIVAFKLPKVCNKSSLYGIGLLFLPSIFYPILGFSRK